MTELATTIQGVRVPRFLYGTAWKEQDTTRLTSLALQAGFRGIDTANQRKHYDEAAVGRAVWQAIESSLVSRDELFLQTKFTFAAGQDHRLPYNQAAPIDEQVEQSFESSQKHLRTDVIDSFVLHGPSQSSGLSDADWSAWHSMERLHGRAVTRLLGVSNVSARQLELLCRHATIRPAFVQNRCYAVRGWDRDVRQTCADYGVVYQGFSLLTANRQLVDHPLLKQFASDRNCTVPQVIFRFAVDIGMIPLTGTTSSEHMQQDLAAAQLRLTPDEVALIENALVR